MPSIVSGFFTIATDFSTATRAPSPYNRSMTDSNERAIDDFASGRIEIEELERRLELVPLESNVTAIVPAVQRTRVVLGSVERTGPWSVPQQLKARVLWGNLLLDLREARLDPAGTTIEVDVTMGNALVIVPPGIVVEVGASSFLGNIEERTERSTAAGPVVRIEGRVKLGNLELTTRRPGESRRDAARRKRAERRAYRRWRRAQPPACDW